MNVKLVGHQGDVVIFEIESFPEGERTQDELTKNHQLALGELSGHNHYFDDTSAVDLFKMPDYEGLTFVDVKRDTPLIHGLIKGFKGTEADKDYHHELKIEPGKYVTGIFEETDWLTRSIKRVVDQNDQPRDERKASEMKRHPIAKADGGKITIEIPDGTPVEYPNGSNSHFLWIGDIDGCICTVSSRAELRKIRNNIDKILAAKELNEPTKR